MAKTPRRNKSRFNVHDFVRLTNDFGKLHEGDIFTVVDPYKNSNHAIKVSDARGVEHWIPTKYLDW